MRASTSTSMSRRSVACCEAQSAARNGWQNYIVCGFVIDLALKIRTHNPTPPRASEAADRDIYNLTIFLPTSMPIYFFPNHQTVLFHPDRARYSYPTALVE